mmetsp:Transcript_41883/g.104571  ORF Transcript_41883/g.104571 Transcript_41883/m.104571 type:complete len:106 (+) Transcript_41883:1917-2234(+)
MPVSGWLDGWLYSVTASWLVRVACRVRERFRIGTAAPSTDVGRADARSLTHAQTHDPRGEASLPCARLVADDRTLSSIETDIYMRHWIDPHTHTHTGSAAKRGHV